MGKGVPGPFYRSVVLALAAGLAGAGPSPAAVQAVVVSGDSVPSDCGAASSATYSTELSGSLVGCWATFVSHINCQELNGFAFYTEIGREEFDGKLEGEAVRFDTQYTFNGVFPTGSCPEPASDKEIVGGCIHYISGRNLVGTMRFYDVMFGEKAPHFVYEGTLTKY